MKKKLIITGLLFLLIAECGYIVPYKGTYKVTLCSVDKYAGVNKMYGNSIISPVKEKKKKKYLRFEEEMRQYRYQGRIKKYCYEDKLIRIIWIVLPNKFEFTLKNKAGYPVKIIWEKAIFIDQDGNQSGVLHAGLRDFLKNNPQPATVVAPKVQINDIIIPTQNLFYEEGDFSGWRIRPLFPNEATSERKLKKLSKKYMGKSVQVILPIQIGSIGYDYYFSFKVEGFMNNWNVF